MKTKLVIFGITGDLSRRKLLPALEHIIAKDDEISIIGVSRREVDVPELLTGSIGNDSFANKVSVFTMDLATPSDYVGLKDFVDLQDDEQALIYLSVPPSAAADIVDFLGQAGLNSPNVKLLFEKPFGFDLTSAQEYIQRTSRYFEEAQIYRIDHYAAKEIAQEIVRLRSDPTRIWNAESVTSIDVVAAEAIGIEDRATFYEETGALRDFIQGHLLQLLALILMPIPDDFNAANVSTYQTQALDAVDPANPLETIRAQYEGYQDEVQNPGSLTETFVSMVLHSNDENWKGVQLRLTTGKNLDKKESSITVKFKDGSETVLEEGKVPIGDVTFSDAYERVLVQAIDGNKSIFTTSPELLRAWEIVKPVQESWEMDNSPLKLYTPGSTVEQVIAE
jgi:glucose-6-phosphate 1-dehydrogenase